MDEQALVKKKKMKILLIVNAIILALGNTGGPLIMRLYFLKGGERVWLSAALETGGWPLGLIPLIFMYINRCKKSKRNATMGDNNKREKLFLMDLPIFLGAVFIGILTGLDDFLYASGVEKLPVSTSQLIIASQLGFTALFAYALVRQKFTAFTVNAVFLLMTGAAVLAINAGSGRPEGESDKEYYVGFAMTIAASILYGFVLPTVELIYKKARQPITYNLVMEFNFVMCFSGTCFCMIGMLINKDFQAIPKEAREYHLGMTMYFIVLFLNGLLWQCFFLGAIGVVFCSSSLLSAILIAVGLPITEVFAVFLYKESFHSEKGLSLVLALWGFVSYFYGELKYNKPKQDTEEPIIELPRVNSFSSDEEAGPAQR